jgi:hypothetical protein
VTDIADRLAKLSKWDELARRAQLERDAAARGDALVAADAPFRDVVEAVGRVVRRHPGMSVVLTPDGGSGSLRVAEQDGDLVVLPVEASPLEHDSSPATREALPSVQPEVAVPGPPAPAGPAMGKRDGRSPERITSDLARLLRRNPDLLAGWPSLRDDHGHDDLSDDHSHNCHG